MCHGPGHGRDDDVSPAMPRVSFGGERIVAHFIRRRGESDLCCRDVPRQLQERVACRDLQIRIEAGKDQRDIYVRSLASAFVLE